MPTSRPSILLVGPYERDNVGDALFLLVTERHLQGADVVAAAPFAADATAHLGRDVPAYGPLLRERPFDVIWTVGGQVGSVDLARAWRMAAPPAAWAAFRAARPRQRRDLLFAAVGAAGAGPGPDVPMAGALPAAPYIPSPLAFAPNAGALTVVNSAGVSGIRHADRARRAELLGLLRGTDVVVVRDPASSALLERQGIAHELAPDAVHALGVQRPAARDPRSPVAVVQVSTGVLAELGHERVADGLARAAAPGGGLEGLRLRFVPAGLATGHDALEDYARLEGLLRARVPGLETETAADRRPEAIVDAIRAARVVVCSSLHVRIVAAAYGVPRVSLQRFKPTRYAKRWDADMPFGVVPDGLPAAVDAALAAGADPGVEARSQALARRADEQLGALVARVLDLARADGPADRDARAARRRAIQLEVLTEQHAAQQVELEALRAELGRLRGSGGGVRRVAARVLRRGVPV